MIEPIKDVPTTFISYAWEDDIFKQRVKEFAKRLRNNGIDAKLDIWEVVPGDQLPYFMERSIRENDYVILCTPKYKIKSENRLGGAGYEGDIMTGEILQYGNARKFIPLIFSGDRETAIPNWLAGKAYIDYTRDDIEASLTPLIHAILGAGEKAPPLGEIPEEYARTAEKIAEKEDAEAVVFHHGNEKENTAATSIAGPFLEAALLWHSGGRAPRGYSNNNLKETDEHGNEVIVIGAGVKPIIYWELSWRLGLAIYNNTSHAAVNISLEIQGPQFSELESLPQINHLKQFDQIELKAGYRRMLESVHTEADEFLRHKVPKDLNGMIIIIRYLDEQRNEHETQVIIEGQNLVNKKIR
ncbi:toll/interleukin-1 receptor domain-containing protein [Mucilaginibacter rubeus]|uniref:TIR domain-containing protein n=1 Tax=Mucilaginibacter rubeus TaxID=2027860 RepID=A0A5C1I311_9SPHI|nr:toll/interleukin-1 receptor domain-containing protein [Mucilaginibacter rubeus]QEM12373.1 TIR domain-containing protein [Mucilaginibacter rubeus]